MNTEELLAVRPGGIVMVNEGDMFYIYKTAVYGHGVFWIGSDVAEGMRELDRFVSLDWDSHHTWNLYKYKPIPTTAFRLAEGVRHESYMDGEDYHELIAWKQKER